MEKRINYYVSKKNFFLWLSVLATILSIVLRCISFTYLELLPIIGGIIFLLIILVNGDEHFYRTAIPMFMLALYFAIKESQNLTIKWAVLIWVACIGTAFIYYRTSCGKERNWLILLIFIGLFGCKTYSVRSIFVAQSIPVAFVTAPDLLIMFAAICIILAMQIHLDNKWHPTWGDRIDGRRIKTLDPMAVVANYVMPTRNGASNHIIDKIEITEIEKYIVEKRKEGYKGFGITHILLATYVRCVAKYPALNRFLSGQRVYSRGDDIQFCMVVKNSMSLEGEESVMKLHLKPTDTVFDIYDKLNAEITRIKTNAVGGSDFDKTAKLFSYVPGLLFKFIVWILKCMDYLGLLPKFLLEVSPFHGTVFFTSLASLGIEPVVHHLYDFGNLPVFCAFGSKYTTKEIGEDGWVHTRKWMDYTFNTDERICDGFYYAAVFKYFKKLLAHPEKLEVQPEEVKRDID